MSVESWKNFFDTLGVILVLATFVCGAGALITGRMVNKRQAEKIQAFTKELGETQLALEKQRERTAKAETDLLEVQKRQEPRNLDAIGVEKFKKLLANKEKSPITISCIAGDSEGCTFARQIADVLTSSGWTVAGVFPKTFIGSGSGLRIHVHAFLPEKDFPVGVVTLSDALIEMGMRPELTYRPDIPANAFELIVGYR